MGTDRVQKGLESNGSPVPIFETDEDRTYFLTTLHIHPESRVNCIEQGLPEPDFKEENGVMTVTFYKDKWNEETLRKLGLNERQIKAVTYVKENGKISNQEYQVVCEISNRTATRDLTKLVSVKIFQQIGITRKGTKYVLRRHKDAKGATKTT